MTAEKKKKVCKEQRGVSLDGTQPKHPRWRLLLGIFRSVWSSENMGLGHIVFDVKKSHASQRKLLPRQNPWFCAGRGDSPKVPGVQLGAWPRQVIDQVEMNLPEHRLGVTISGLSRSRSARHRLTRAFLESCSMKLVTGSPPIDS